MSTEAGFHREPPTNTTDSFQAIHHDAPLPPNILNPHIANMSITVDDKLRTLDVPFSSRGPGQIAAEITEIDGQHLTVSKTQGIDTSVTIIELRHPGSNGERERAELTTPLPHTPHAKHRLFYRNGTELPVDSLAALTATQKLIKTFDSLNGSVKKIKNPISSNSEVFDANEHKLSTEGKTRIADNWQWEGVTDQITSFGVQRRNRYGGGKYFVVSPELSETTDLTDAIIATGITLGIEMKNNNIPDSFPRFYSTGNFETSSVAEVIDQSRLAGAAAEQRHIGFVEVGKRAVTIGAIDPKTDAYARFRVKLPK